jgi:hypothetical protein
MNNNLNSDKPVVFLDIDGVLNSTQFFKMEDTYPKSNPRSQLDSEAISYLNEIADWNFVLSSTWRKFYDKNEMNNMLNDMGFNGTIIDYTPDLNWQGSIRGNEIMVWMRENNLGDSKKYVIFDDDSDILYWQRNNFIHVDNHFGLGPNHVWRAKKILNF